MPDLALALRDPIPLGANRIPRFYRGGRLLDAFRGTTDPVDDDRPEDWVGSATRTWTPPGAAPASELGLSRVEVGGRSLSLESILAAEPEALIGPHLLAAAGPTLGILVKLLDAGERLPVHCHPTRQSAASLLGSPFGKTEAWIILGTRDAGARIWAGFREPVEHATLRRWIDEQDTDALLGSLQEVPVSASDAYLIPAGAPHAIGAGVFLLELQEPTDFSVVAETRGFPISEDDASLGLGWDRAIAFFDTDASGDLRQPESALSDGRIRLLGSAADPFVRAERLRVNGETPMPIDPSFAIGVVLSGSGEIRGRTTALALRRGATFALPAASALGARIAGDELEVILCLPPDAASLVR